MYIKFLKICVLMTSMISSTSAFSIKNSPKVVVIGGGLAGLTTAYRLQKKGMNVDLYEAKKRVGGRVFTSTINGRTAELGGQNISDGGEAIHLNQLIDEFGLNRTSSRVNLSYSYFDGIDFISYDQILKNKNVDPENLKNHLDMLASSSFNMKEILEKFVSPLDPLYKILEVRISAYEGGNIDQLSPLYTDTLFHMLLGGICSVHQCDKDKNPYVDLLTIEGGNYLLPKKMGEALGENLHLNMPLTKVSKSINGSFEITFKNGIKTQADILVLAIPCSVYDQIIFEEEIIAESKLEAIANIKYGTNAKILVPFTSEIIKGEPLIGNEIITWFDQGQNILTLYFTGDSSLFTADTIASSYFKVHPMIERGLENCPLFTTPLFVKDEVNLFFDGPIGYSWPNDPYAKGTYSYIAAGQEDILTATEEKNGEIFKALFSPLDNHLYFAGEHASILFDVPGTMEAACESGERIARTILKSCSWL